MNCLLRIQPNKKWGLCPGNGDPGYYRLYTAAGRTSAVTVVAELAEVANNRYLGLSGAGVAQYYQCVPYRKSSKQACWEKRIHVRCTCYLWTNQSISFTRQNCLGSLQLHVGEYHCDFKKEKVSTVTTLRTGRPRYRSLIPGGGQEFHLLPRGQTDSGIHPDLHSMGTGDSFPRDKSAGYWSWPLTFM